MATEKSTTGVSKSQFSIVRAICAAWKLGNDGKLDSFFIRTTKTLNKEVIAHKKNLDTIKFNHEQYIEDLNDELDDAKEALENSYLNVDVNQIDTNEKQIRYVDVYLENVDKHLCNIQRIEKRIENADKDYIAEVKATQDQIDSLNKRIERISKN